MRRVNDLSSAQDLQKDRFEDEEGGSPSESCQTFDQVIRLLAEEASSEKKNLMIFSMTGFHFQRSQGFGFILLRVFFFARIRIERLTKKS
jgi:hypothetical protein